MERLLVRGEGGTRLSAGENCLALGWLWGQGPLPTHHHRRHHTFQPTNPSNPFFCFGSPPPPPQVSYLGTDPMLTPVGFLEVS